MIQEYYEWWARQMLDLVRPLFSAPEKASADALLIEPEGELLQTSAITATLQSGRGAQLRSLGRFALDQIGLEALRKVTPWPKTAPSIRLCLPSGLLLEKRLAFPLAAERELRRVLAYEMDRETPFSADEAWWSWRIIHRDRKRGQLQVALSLVPKASIATLLEALSAGGFAPTALDAPSPDGTERRRIALQPAGTAGNGWTGRFGVLEIACASLALIAIALPFVRQAVALGHVDAEIARLQPAIDEVQRLRRQIDNNGADSALLTNERARVGDALQVLATTTEVLPDDTHLVDLTLHQRKLSMNGQSGAAAKLIPILTAHPLFKDPAFSAPVIRGPGSKFEIFSISAEIRP